MEYLIAKVLTKELKPWTDVLELPKERNDIDDGRWW